MSFRTVSFLTDTFNVYLYLRRKVHVVLHFYVNYQSALLITVCRTSGIDY